MIAEPMRRTSGLSLRDPDGVLSIVGDRVIREISAGAAAGFADILQRPIVRELMDSGRLVKTHLAEQPVQYSYGKTVTLYEHERIPFISYPCEWSRAMLAAAAEFTLRLCIDLLPHGLILKDATPANILFRGATPVLVDVPSISLRPQGSFLWYAREQFERSFMLPLILRQETATPIGWSLQDAVHGISHEHAARIIGLKRWLKLPLVATVALPAALGRFAESQSAGAARTMSNDAQAVYTLERTLRSLLGKVMAVSKSIGSETSMWKGYTSARDHYTSADLARKSTFISSAIENAKPQWVLDVGANTGEFSQLSARHAAVVSLDSDESSVTSIFQHAAMSGSNIVALVANFARPTPAFGWGNAETFSLLDRLAGRFDLVLMLAVVHHLRISEGIPTSHILDAALQITRRRVLIEHVPPSDPMFQRLSRGRTALYADMEKSPFEQLLRARFRVEHSLDLQNGRTLYLAEKLAGRSVSG